MDLLNLKKEIVSKASDLETFLGLIRALRRKRPTLSENEAETLILRWWAKINGIGIVAFPPNQINQIIKNINNQFLTK